MVVKINIKEYMNLTYYEIGMKSKANKAPAIKTNQPKDKGKNVFQPNLIN